MDASLPPMKLQENGDGAFKSAGEIILQWESRGARKEHLFGGSRQEIDEYLQAVYEIQRSISSSMSEDQSRAKNFMSIAMARLMEEFHVVLISPKSSIGTHWLPGTSSLYWSSMSTVCELQDYHHQLNEESIRDLRNIAEMMNSAGYLHVCVQVYVSVWKSFMDKSFQRFGIEHISIAGVKRILWEELELKIRRWMQAANCLHIFFAREKQLREQIFEGIADETCFMEMFKEHAILLVLLNFAQVVSSVSPRPEQLFRILDLYTTLSDLSPEIYAVFNSKSLESIRIQAAETHIQVAEAARGMLSEFENAVLHEVLKVLAPEGTIHSLARYVMNCMILMASTYRKTLTELIVSKPSIGLSYSGEMMINMEFVELDWHTPLALHFIWIIVVLQFNLEGKSKGYKDASLAHLFMMNNVYYIVQKINGCRELREMTGDNFLCLYFGENSLKGKLKRFYAMFERAHETQAKWLVLDLQQREELHLSILNKLIPSYKSFMDRLHGMYGKRSDKYIKYTVEDLENAISDFFEGHPVSKKLRTSQSKGKKCGIIP
ncbi:exocyst complex component EXO70B1-like [Cornus florida]|uniref:exocyst complex component EXO70B1-like n=1 Tax=Cornus florida TaxID=4283 RepID=UPI00289FCDC1|nr:exocyst complex component EXO70B1-like [Cornus florida]